jgi:uncharacterized membrane protein
MLQATKSWMLRFARNDAGVISVMGAMALMLALAVTMIVVDTGAMLSAKRSQQAATDAAALGAVRQLDNAQATAEEILFTLNSFDSNASTATARPVYFVADPSRAPDQRYFEIGETASDGTLVDMSNVNAVRVTMLGESPTYFARLFGFDEMTRIETFAVAAFTKHVSFSAGTRLASLEAGIANQVLGGLLGTTLNLSLIDYNALADTTIDALSFLDALAIRAGLEAGSDTYGDLLGTTVTAGQLLDAAIEVLNGETAEGNPSVAKVALQSALAPVQNGSIPVDRILGATPYSDRVIGSVQTIPGSTIPIGVLDLLTGTATLLGEGKAVGFGTNVNIGSLASVNGTIRVGAPMAHMAVGKVGDSVETSQVEVQLAARIQIDIPLVLTTSIDLPVFVRAASGTAVVEAIPCTSGGTISSLSGTTDAGLARVGTGESGPSAGITLTLLSLIPINVPISGSVPIASSGPTNLSFSENEFGQPKQTASQVNVISNLGDAITIGGALTGQILSGLTSAIASALSPLDQILNAVLAAVGIKLGAMDMIVHGAKCHAPVLVR